MVEPDPDELADALRDGGEPALTRAGFNPVVIVCGEPHVSPLGQEVVWSWK